ncbi:MAG: ABC transporter permease [Saprospiraceae bacterium]|nr:ABC transporter permease [Saprospiraceae bacterium]
MFQNYFKIAIRNLTKQKLYSIINISGLAVGLACAILILLWVQDELSYDSFHSDKDRIYRMNWDFSWNGSEGVGPGTPPPLAAALQSEIIEIEEVTRIYPISQMVVRHEDRFFREDQIFAVDSTFFDFFDFELKTGDPKNSLIQPNSVLITEAIAKKYFGDASPVGKFITIGEDNEGFWGKYSSTFQVTGILENPPHNSHFQFDILTSMPSHPIVKGFDWSWVWMQVVTYAKLKEGASVATVQAKIPAIVKKYAPAAFTRIGFSFDELMENGGRWNFLFQPLSTIYLDSGDTGNRLGPVGNRMYVSVFSVIAGFVLFLACINFMNLATARSANRAREVGVRKTLGSERKSLVRQFLVESVLYSFLALPIAMIITKLSLPAFNRLSGKTLELNPFEPWWLSVGLLALTLVVGFVAGSYPSFYLSSFRPVQVLKGSIHTGGKSQRLRNALVVFQFTITIGLIASTLLVQQQMDYLRKADIGFDKEGVVIISNENHPLGNQAETFKEEIKSDARIVDATVSTGVPPYSGFMDYYKAEGKEDELFELTSYTTDEDFLGTMGIELLDGRAFSKEFSEAKNVILNESAVALFGWDNPIGKKIHYPGSGDFEVIGVIKDFNFNALYSAITPFALFHHDSKSYDISNSYIITRIKSNDVQQSIQLLESQWKKFAPDHPFEYEFQDESFEQQYLAEQRLGRIFLIFSALTIFIACIGLLGLVAFAVEQRTKEIGIRKVLGASVPDLVALLSKDFTKWVIIANVLACPLAYYAMNQWLQNFAYRVDIQWWIFVAAGALALMVALLTVSFQAIRAAMANPVDSLKTE